MIRKILGAKHWVLAPAGALLLLAAAPAAVLADGSPSDGTSTFSCSVNGVTSTISTTSSYSPDPVAASKYFGDSEIASTPSNLPSGMMGISGSGPTTGSITSPIAAGTFAAGYGDETQLYEQVNISTTGASPAGSPGAYDASQPGLNNLPSGTVTGLNKVTYTGAGLPYAQVYPIVSGAVDFTKPLITGGIPTQIYYESYTTNPTAWMPNGTQPNSSCGDHMYAVLDFNVSAYVGGALTAGQPYAAYLLVRDTDISGPLANHLWYFMAPATQVLGTPSLSTTPTPAAATVGAKIADQATITGLVENSGSLPTSDTASFQLVSSCPANGTAPTSAQVVADLGASPVTLSPAGAAYSGTATSASFTTTKAGTYYWDVSFSGDSGNGPIAYQCGETVTINASTTPPSGGVLGASTTTPGAGADLLLPGLLAVVGLLLGGLLFSVGFRLRRRHPA